MVAVPGYDVRPLPALRKTGIEKAAKKKGGGTYADQPMLMNE